MVYAVRGAIGVDQDSHEDICGAVQLLIPEICRRNGISEDDLVSIIFSQTEDLRAANPAACLRRIGYAAVPLFCTREPEYPDSLPRILRTLVTFRSSEGRSPIPVYEGRAASLRPDLSGNTSSREHP